MYKQPGKPLIDRFNDYLVDLSDRIGYKLKHWQTWQRDRAHVVVFLHAIVLIAVGIALVLLLGAESVALTILLAAIDVTALFFYFDSALWRRCNCPQCSKVMR